MKRNIIIIILSFLFLYKLSAQDYKQIVITGDFSNLTFEEFAGIMKKDYGIFIYYKHKCPG